jgi:hypothetical protein
LKWVGSKAVKLAQVFNQMGISPSLVRFVFNMCGTYLALFRRGLIYVSYFASFFMLQGQYANPIELEEVELSPENLVFMLKSIQARSQPENDLKYSQVAYREILSAGSHSVLTTDRNLIYQLDVEHPLNYADAFASNWWIIDEKCSFSGRYNGPFPDLSFAARTFQLSYFIKLLEDYFDRLIVSKEPDQLALNYYFKAASSISPMKISGSLLFDHENQLLEIQLFLQFKPRTPNLSIESLHLVNTYSFNEKLSRQQAMTTYIDASNKRITQFQDFRFSEVLVEANHFQLPIDSNKPLKPSCYEP